MMGMGSEEGQNPLPRLTKFKNTSISTESDILSLRQMWNICKQNKQSSLDSDVIGNAITICISDWCQFRSGVPQLLHPSINYL